MEVELSSNVKLLESHIMKLQKELLLSSIDCKYEKKSYEYYIFLYIPSKENNNKNFELLLLINLLKNRIYLYSFNIVKISDGRDLLPFITNKLKNLSLIGRFYLGEEYNINIISNLKNIYAVNCYHRDLINGNYYDIPSLVTISDDYFCLYEYNTNNMKDNNKFTLVFYGNIKSIISFKKSLVGSIVNINFRKDMNGKDLSLKIMSDIDNDMENIMDLLIKKIENIGYRMNIYQKRNGNIPEINIQNTEENIKTYEDKLNTEEENGKVIKELLELYEKAIEYYSAINDKRYMDYNNKIRRILKNEKYSKLIA